MSAEKLKALIEQGNLINLDIVSDSLKSLIEQISHMLVEQQQQIIDLKAELAKKLDSDTFNQFRVGWAEEKNGIVRSFPNFNEVIAKMTRENEDRISKMKDFVDKQINGAIISVDTRIAVKLSENESEQSLLSHRISTLESKQQMGAQPEAVDISPLKKRLEHIEEQVSHLPIKSQVEELIQSKQKEFDDKISAMQASIPKAKEEPIKEESHPVVATDLPSGIEPIIEKVVKEDDVSSLAGKVETIEAKLDEQNKSLASRIERKAEINLTERMFEKLRVIIATVRDEVGAITKKSETYVTTQELEERLTSTINSLIQDEQSSFTKKQIKCVACGRPRLRSSNATADLKSPDLPFLLPSRLPQS